MASNRSGKQSQRARQTAVDRDHRPIHDHVAPGRNIGRLLEQAEIDTNTATVAVGAGLGELSQEAFANPFAGHLDQA